jgi:hypothetical protein
LFDEEHYRILLHEDALEKSKQSQVLVALISAEAVGFITPECNDAITYTVQSSNYLIPTFFRKPFQVLGVDGCLRPFGAR